MKIKIGEGDRCAIATNLTNNCYWFANDYDKGMPPKEEIEYLSDELHQVVFFENRHKTHSTIHAVSPTIINYKMYLKILNNCSGDPDYRNRLVNSRHTCLVFFSLEYMKSIYFYRFNNNCGVLSFGFMNFLIKMFAGELDDKRKMDIVEGIDRNKSVDFSFVGKII